MALPISPARHGIRDLLVLHTRCRKASLASRMLPHVWRALSAVLCWHGLRHAKMRINLTMADLPLCWVVGTISLQFTVAVPARFRSDLGARKLSFYKYTGVHRTGAPLTLGPWPQYWWACPFPGWRRSPSGTISPYVPRALYLRTRLAFIVDVITLLRFQLPVPVFDPAPESGFALGRRTELLI